MRSSRGGLFRPRHYPALGTPCAYCGDACAACLAGDCLDYLLMRRDGDTIAIAHRDCVRRDPAAWFAYRDWLLCEAERDARAYLKQLQMGEL